MKSPKLYVVLLILLAVVFVSRCEKDDDNCSSCPPPTIGTPYELEVPEGFPQPFIPADNPMTEEGVELGRHLFYENRLSGNSTMSCASCHNQILAFGDMSAKSTGVSGEETRRNSMPLFNLAWQEVFFWDGRAQSLEEQSLHPIIDPLELNGDLPTIITRLEADSAYPDMFNAAFGDHEITEDRIAKALAQFERSIVSADSKFDRVVRLEKESFTESEQRGFELYTDETGDCFHCHGPKETRFIMGAFGEDNTFMNNGVKADYSQDEGRKEITGDPSDLGKFKVPTTRNVEYSFPYMHDGSIPSLDSLVEFYNFGGHKVAGNNIDPNMKAAGEGRQWTTQQKIDLKAFLRTMTDYTFLENPEYSDPFEE